MTLNDMELCALLTEIHKQETLLEYFERENHQTHLFSALDRIRNAAHHAMNRLNAIQQEKRRAA